MGCPHAVVIQQPRPWALATCPDPALRIRPPAPSPWHNRSFGRPPKRVVLEHAGSGLLPCGRLGRRDWRCLKRVHQARAGGDSNDWFFLAMACWKRGQQEPSPNLARSGRTMDGEEPPARSGAEASAEAVALIKPSSKRTSHSMTIYGNQIGRVGCRSCGAERFAKDDRWKR